MSAIIHCVGCPSQLRVREDRFGELIRCPNCKSLFKVDRGPDGLLAIQAVVVPSGSMPALPAPPPLPPPEPPPQRAYRARVPPPTPPPIVVHIDLPDPKRYELQEPPFLTDDGAVVECPWCGKRADIREREFDDELACKKCEGVFTVSVRDDGMIGFKCPSCFVKMEADVEMAGEDVACIRQACRYFPIDVPASPVVVKKVKDEEARPKLWPMRRTLPSPPSPPPPPPVDPRLCRRCGLRFVRNPTGICWECRKR